MIRYIRRLVNINAVTPEEIALSIMAEIVKVRRAKGVGKALMTNTAIILLAAGFSHRMGSVNKLLLPFDGVACYVEPRRCWPLFLM